ncbi:MAG: LytTR family DNA-binding domain-containing protein, partial [Bacteroidales bacterium]|nr:LytTR family DNA-binding domain-containing protein [Bacteroidales bacterium]
MPDISGLQFVKSLTNPPLVVFSTAYEDYAVEAFKVDAIDYLLKPYGYQDFLKAAVKVRQYLELKKNAETTSSAEGDDSNYIFVRADNKSVKVRLDDIFFIEAMSEYVKIHFKDGSSIMTFMSIKLMVDSLPASRFMRVHRSYIVALEVIDNMHRSEIVLSDGTILPVSASYKEVLQHYIDTHSVIRKPIH